MRRRCHARRARSTLEWTRAPAPSAHSPPRGVIVIVIVVIGGAGRGGPPVTSSLPPKLGGRFALGAAQPQWGPGWFAARSTGDDDEELPGKVLVRVALTGEAPSLALEGAARMKMQALLRSTASATTDGLVATPALPTLLRRGSDKATSWLCFEAAVAVKLDALLDAGALPVPVALAFAASFARTLATLDAVRLAPADDDGGARAPIGPSFDELLVTREGALVMTTPPPGTRMTLAGLLRVPRRDRFLHPPEGVRGDLAGDRYAVGSFLAQLLLDDDPADAGGDFVDVAPARTNPDVPRRVDDIVRRLTARDPGARHESWDEVLRDLAAAAEDWPPTSPEDAAALVKARAPLLLADAERSLLP